MHTETFRCDVPGCEGRHEQERGQLPPAGWWQIEVPIPDVHTSSGIRKPVDLCPTCTAILADLFRATPMPRPGRKVER